VFTELCARVGFYFVQGRCLQHPMFVGANLVFARVGGMVRYWGKWKKPGNCLPGSAPRGAGNSTEMILFKTIPIGSSL